MSAATTASVVGIAVGVNSLTGGQLFGTGGKNAAAEQQRLADPFSSHRGKLGDMYSDYLTGKTPTNLNEMPGYTSFQSGVLDPALESTKRSMAASGQMQSGNEAIALQKVGQQGYYGFMTDYLNRLATGSGATQGPATAAGQGYAAGQNYDTQMMQGLGGTLQGIAGLYGGRGNTNTSSSPTLNYGSLPADAYQYSPF
jgi:hypothetical protein